jgi:hypothetical protein
VARLVLVDLEQDAEEILVGDPAIEQAIGGGVDLAQDADGSGRLRAPAPKRAC